MRWSKAAFLSLLSSAVVLLAGLGTGILAARLLGPEGRGVLAGILTVTTIASSVCVLPLSDYLVVRSKNNELADDMHNSFSFSLLFGFAVCAIAIIPTAISFQDYSNSALTLGLVVLFVSVLVQVPGEIYRGKFRTEGRFHLVSYFTMLQPITYLLSTFLLIWIYKKGVEAFLLGNILAMLFVFIVRISTAGYKFLLPVKLRYSLPEIGYVFGLYAHKILVILSSQIDKLLLIFLCSIDELGFYVVAYTYSGVVAGVLVTALRLLVLPILAKEKPSTINGVYTLVFIVCMLLSALSIFFIIISSSFFIPLLFGVNFSPSVEVSNILAIGLGLGIVRALLDEMLKHAKLSAALIYISVFQVLSTTIISLFLIASLGFKAVAVGLSFSMLATVYFQIKILQRNGTRFDWEGARRISAIQFKTFLH